jgi:hypothetical protein
MTDVKNGRLITYPAGRRQHLKHIHMPVLPAPTP